MRVLAKLLNPVKSGLLKLKSIALGDAKNNRISYRDKRAIGELHDMKTLRATANRNYLNLLKHPNARNHSKIIRRYIAANTKMNKTDEINFFKKRNKRINQVLAGAGLVIPGGTVLTGLSILNANKKHVLDQRYEFMKKKGYVQ